MEKAKLNTLIVQCRAAVRKARVCIIRKKIKKLKILKSCKNEKEMDKKMKKSERLLEEILLLKKVKEDDVTKFALQQTDLNEVLKKTLLNDHEHVYATLAVYPDVQKQLNQVKNTFPDPEALLKLLQSLGTKSAQKKNKKKSKESPLMPPKIIREEKDESDNDEVELPVKSPKIKETVQKNLESKLSNSEIFIAKPVKKQNDIVVSVKEKEPEEKVDDPFFVSKKVAIPKLILDEVKENPKREIKFSKPDTSFTKQTHKKYNSAKAIPNRRKYDGESYKSQHADPPVAPVEEKEKLHPSWAAKKIKLIQPFQGTKIKFDD